MLTKMSRLIVLFLLVCWSAGGAVAQVLYIGGHRAVRDLNLNRWLCSIPQENFGHDWTTTLEFDSACTNVVLNGERIVNGQEVTFDSIDAGTEYSFQLLYQNRSYKGNITFTWLPVMELYGTFGDEYAGGTIWLNYPDGTIDESMQAKLKWRGGITNSGVRLKRNYSIKFIDDDGQKVNRSFLGLRKDNHWKLDAAQMDLLRVRNRVSTDLWLDMSAKPWYAELEPKVVNGSRGRTIELLLNSRYMGIYHLIEPVDRKQLKLEKHDTIDNVFHGQLWYNKTWNRTGTMGNPIDWSNDEENWDGIHVEYPDFEDVHPTDWSTLARAVTFSHDASVNKQWDMFADSVGKYFDEPVLIDYFVFIVTLQALDNESKNIMYSCYDKQLDQRLLMTPWDLDVSTGSKLQVTWDDRDIAPDRYIYWISHVPMLNLFNHSKPYHRRIIRRYWELRKTYLDVDSLIQRFQTAVDELEACGAAAREEKRWSKSADIGGRVLDISAEMEYVADWIRWRIAFLDEEIFPPLKVITGDVDDNGEVNIVDINIVIELILGGTASDVIMQRADVNGDGEINIVDINALIDIILK